MEGGWQEGLCLSELPALWASASGGATRGFGRQAGLEHSAALSMLSRRLL